MYYIIIAIIYLFKKKKKLRNIKENIMIKYLLPVHMSTKNRQTILGETLKYTVILSYDM